LEAKKEWGLNLIAATRINQHTLPSVADFENSEILVLSFASWKEQQEIGWFYSNSFKRDVNKIEVTGRLKVEFEYEPDDHSKGFYFGGSGDSLKEKIENQFEFEKTNARPKKQLTIKQLIRKSKWKLW
jgi:hypothetical protein